MIVSMWMTKDLITIRPGTLVTEAAATMAENRIRRLPVIEGHGERIHPVGIVTATDVLHAYPPHVNPFAVEAVDTSETQIKVEEIMSRSLQTVTPETPIEDAAGIMKSKKISTLPVVQKIKLVGLITESDIFRAFVSILGFSQTGVRITFENCRKEDTFGIIASLALKWNVQITSFLSVQKDERNLFVIRLTGTAADKMLTEIWNSGYKVLNVIHLPA